MRGMEIDARLRLRAARYLAGHALRGGDDPPRSGIDAAQYRRAKEVSLEAALEAYADLGLLSAEEAAEWRSSTSTLARGRVEGRRAGDPTRARALLDRRL